MSTLQVANVWFESTANNRIQYTGANSFVMVAGGANTLFVSNSMGGSIGVGDAPNPVGSILGVSGSTGGKLMSFLSAPGNAIWGHLKSTATNCTGVISFAETGVTNFDFFGAWNPTQGNRFRVSGDGSVQATGNITAYYSDIRLKTNITIISNALDKVKAISGVTYKNNDLAISYGYTDQEQQVGVLAQQIEAVLPEAVKLAPFDAEKTNDGTYISKSGENYKTVQYDRIVPLLIEAIKELEQRVADLEAR